MTVGPGPAPSAPSPRGAGLAVAAALAATLSALAGCSGSASPASPTDSASTGSPAGKPADRQTTREISAAYAALFGSSSTQQAAVAALQHGSVFASTIASESTTSYAQKSSAKVTDVRLRSADLAAVTFTITSNGAVMLSDVKGNAIRENGTWKVAADTFCGLLRLQGGAPKACSDPRITALPH